MKNKHDVHFASKMKNELECDFYLVNAKNNK